jgi:hypothetical protein
VNSSSGTPTASPVTRSRLLGRHPRDRHPACLSGVSHLSDMERVVPPGAPRREDGLMPWFPDFVSAAELARAQTRADGRADPVGRYFAALTEGDPRVLETVWPGEVVVHSQWPVDGRHHIRPPILRGTTAGPGDVVGRLQRAIEAGDTDAAVGTFAPGGCLRGPLGIAEPRSYFSGTIGLRDCAVTDDGVRCAVEYNCDRWGGRDVPPQAGIVVFERGPGGLLRAVRIYDDVER